MNQSKGGCISELSLDEIFQDSIDINHLHMINSPLATEDNITQYFFKRIKLRNAIKRSIWNRKELHNTSNIFHIQALNIIPSVCISPTVEQSMINYLLNNPNSDFIGRLIQSTPCLYDKIEPSEDVNLILDPGSLPEEETREKLNKLLIKASSKITKHKEPFHTLFVYKIKEDKVYRKLWSIFPNCNFQLTQVHNMSFSNTELNKYLVSKNSSNVFNTNDYKNGLLTLSQQNRLITLSDDNKNPKHAIIGLWINLKDEQPSAKKIDLDKMLLKHQMKIYFKCFEFIERSATMESVYSPSPEESIFLLVIFYHGMQCQYEVKIVSNKFNQINAIDYDKDNNKNISTETDNIWLIAKKKKQIDASFASIYSFNIKEELQTVQMMTLPEFIKQKSIGNNIQISYLAQSQMNNTDDKNNNNTLILPQSAKKVNDFKEKDNTDEQFEELLSNTYLDIDSFDDLYNYPLMIPQHKHNPSQMTYNPKTIINKANSFTPIKDNNNNALVTQLQPNKKQNEELYYSQASTNSHSNLLLSLKHSNNSNVLNQYNKRLTEQSETLKQLNSKVSMLHNQTHQLLNRILTSQEHSAYLEDHPVKDYNQVYNKNINSNVSIQVPHIFSVDITFNDDD